MNPGKGHIIVTGGAGYIGATVCSALIDNGWTPIIIDNLSSGPRAFTKGRIFYEGDIADSHVISRVFREYPSVYATIHCAAKIIVPESVDMPELYYRENVSKSVDLFAMLRDHGCPRVVFSSSAAIYGLVDQFMVNESSPLNPSSPYSRTKFMMEMVLQDFCAAYDMQGISLRYFNPIGADPQYRSGAYIASPTHILGKMIAAESSNDPLFEITGCQWPTRDGTGIRDYIHVWDLAQAHVKAVENFNRALRQTPPYGPNHKNYRVINLGTGRGVTVREFVNAFEEVTGKSLRKKESPPRPGDVAGSYANADTAKLLIDWQAELSLQDGIRSALAWSKKYSNLSESQ